MAQRLNCAFCSIDHDQLAREKAMAVEAFAVARNGAMFLDRLIDVVKFGLANGAQQAGGLGALARYFGHASTVASCRSAHWL